MKCYLWNENIYSTSPKWVFPSEQADKQEDYHKVK